MIYIIVSNIGLAIMMLVVYFRYSKFRLKNAAEIKALKAANVKHVAEKKELEERLMGETKEGSSRSEKLLKDLDLLRQEKEVELRLRGEAEKQSEVALQKVEAIEKRMNDWRLIQDAAMADAKDVLIKLGNDLFKKVNEVQKLEAETNKNLFSRINEKIENSFAKLFTTSPGAIAPEPKKSEAPVFASARSNVDGLAKKLLSDLINTMNAAGHLVNKNYFLPSNFDATKARLMLCDIAFLKQKKLYIVDFKSCNYFAEYNSSADKVQALEVLKQRMDKCISYMGNPKYYEAIARVMSMSNVHFEEAFIVIAIPSKADLKLLKDIRYYEKAHQSSLDIIDFDDINSMVI